MLEIVLSLYCIEIVWVVGSESKARIFKIQPERPIFLSITGKWYWRGFWGVNEQSKNLNWLLSYSTAWFNRYNGLLHFQSRSDIFLIAHHSIVYVYVVPLSIEYSMLFDNGLGLGLGLVAVVKYPYFFVSSIITALN